MLAKFLLPLVVLLNHGAIRGICRVFYFQNGTARYSDKLCLEFFSHRVDTSPIPNNTRLIFDTNLHDSRIAANSWTFVNNDDSSLTFRRVTNGGDVCLPEYTVCEESQNRNNWLVSPYMSGLHALAPSGLPAIEVSVTFIMTQCSGSVAACSNRKLQLVVWPTSTNQTINKQQLTHFIPALSSVFVPPANLLSPSLGQALPIFHSWIVPLPTPVDGLRLAFIDNGACTAVLRVNVTSRFCLATMLNFADFPQVVSGTQPLVVQGVCSTSLGRVAEHGQAVTLNCSVDGSWDTNSMEGTCVCPAGYEDGVGGMCVGCAANSYKADAGSSSCLPCPAESSSQERSVSCTCVSGAYRLSAESIDTNCTRPPAQLSAGDVLLTMTAFYVNITWKTTSYDGGRSDVAYELSLRRSAASLWVKLGVFPANVTSRGRYSVTKGSLYPFTDYTIRVFVLNGVTSLANITKSEGYTITFKTLESIPDGPPTAVQLSQLRLGLRIQWQPPAVPNGIIIRYTLRLGQGAGLTVEKNLPGTARSYDFHKLNYSLSYFVTVAASTSVGMGNFSSEEIGQPGGPEYTRPEDGEGSSSSSNTGVVVGGVVGGLIAFILIIVLVLLLNRRRSNGHFRYNVKRSPRPESFASEETNQSTLTLRSLRESIKSRSPSKKGKSTKETNIKMYQDPSNYGDPQEALGEFTRELNPRLITTKKKIGEGEFGEVCLGTLRTHDGMRQVALKVLKAGADHKTKTDFLMEASVLGQFNHKNIITLVGICSKDKNKVMIAMEYAEHGSLHDYLLKHSGKLSPNELVSMVEGVADGMCYLSSMNFIHRDLAARNILIDSSHTCKISDFGLSREALDPDQAYEVKTVGGKLPIRWTAPEAFQFQRFTTASDVWSFGILLWEVMSFGERPYWDWSNADVINALTKTGYRLPPPKGCPDEVHQLMLQCWEKDASGRPTFQELHKKVVVLQKKKLPMQNLNPRPVSTLAPLTTDSTITEWLAFISLSILDECFLSCGYTKVGECLQLTVEDLDALGIVNNVQQHAVLSSLKEIAERS